jgi:hypothetical protein
LKVAGLNIEDSYIKAAILNKRFGAIQWLRTEEIKLGDEKTKVLKEALFRWKNETGIEGIVVGLDSKNFSHTSVKLPLKTREDISRALPFEMEKHLPLSPDEYLHDFFTVETTNTGTKNLVLSIKKEKLQWITECVKDAGLKLLGVRCSGIEALNEFLLSEKAQNVIFLYPRQHAYCIFGLKDSVLSYFRVLCDVDEVLIEIERISETYNGGIYAEGIKNRTLAEKLNAKSLSYSMPNLIALSIFRKRPIDLNFIPEEFVAPKIDYYPYAIVTMSILSILIFFSTSIFSYYKDYAALKKVDARINEIKTTAHELVETKKELEAIEEKRKFLLEFQSKRNININVLRQLSLILPEEAWLTSFSADEKGKVEIVGFADRAANIIEPLEKSPLFKNVEFSSPVTVKDGMERFSLKMEVER